MGMISVRLNEDEEKILKKLSCYYNAGTSTLVKKSLFELYENMVDLNVVNDFEEEEKQGKTSFYTATDLFND